MNGNGHDEKTWADELDAMTAAPDHHEVLLENDRVRVLDSLVKAGEATPVHTHRWPAVLYILGSSDFVRYDAHGLVIFDSRSAEKNAEAGRAIWAEPLAPHSVKNVGTGEIRVVAIELKD